MTHEERLEKIREIENLSPLEMSKNLMDIELHDLKSSQEILDEVYKSFESKDSIIDEVLFPCMFTVVDGLAAGVGVKNKKSGQVGKYGISASRFMNEVKTFSYDENKTYSEHRDLSILKENGMTESIKKNMRIFNKNTGRNYKRENIEDTTKMNGYKEEYFKNKKSTQDEYDKKSVVYLERNNPDKRFRNEGKHRNQAETDHVISAHHVYKRYESNIAFDDRDIKDIANIAGNFAVTSNKTNNPKRQHSAKELRELKKQGKIDIPDEVIDAIEIKEHEAIEKMEIFANKRAQKKIKIFDNSLDEEQLKAVAKLKGKKKIKEIKRLKKENLKSKGKMYGRVGGEASAEMAQEALGDVMMLAITPITYEIMDSIKNGVEDGVKKKGVMDAIKYRFSRVFKYLINKLKSFKIKISDALSTLLQKMVNILIKIYFQGVVLVAKIVMRGFSSLIQAYNTVFGKGSEELSKSEKTDAIVKVIGSLVTAVAGVFIEDLLDNALPEALSVPLSVIITGILTTLVTFQLNKMDLFSVKAEKRHSAVKEIFDKRVAEIKEAAELFDEKAIQTLKKHQNLHSNISKNINLAFENGDIDVINENIFELAEFFNVKMEYSNTNEFIEYFDSAEKIVI